jgi:signal transduction histidine kinase
LAIARQFVELQGGRIFAHNLPEGGLQVGFVLPAHRSLVRNDQ